MDDNCNDFPQCVSRVRRSLPPLLTSWLLASLLSVCGSSIAQTPANLLINGDAQAGLCANDWLAVKTIPGWRTLLGSPTVLCNAIMKLTGTDEKTSGKAFFAAGPYGDSVLVQTIDIADAAQAIDASQVTYQLSGALGGKGRHIGEAQVVASFLGGHGEILGPPAKLDGATAKARDYANRFLARSVSGAVPAGTRTISVQLQFIHTAPVNNVGYARDLSLTLSVPVAPRPLQRPPSQVPHFDHVFFVMMENTDFSQLIGSRHAPFINQLAREGTLLANYNGVAHPSDENYLAVAAGDTYVQGAVYFPELQLDIRHIGDQLDAAGKTWKAYEQGMGTPCNLTSKYDKDYLPDDAPFILFSNVAKDPVRCAQHLVDTRELATDLGSGATTPDFLWIAADEYHDGEDSGNGNAHSLQVQDKWLKQLLQPIFASPAWTSQRSLLILTWDESARQTGYNQIATIVYGSKQTTASDTVSTRSYNHYSTARVIEDALGVDPMTANDRYVEPYNDAFSADTRMPASTLSASLPEVAVGANVVLEYILKPDDRKTDAWIALFPRQTQTLSRKAALLARKVPVWGGVAGISTAHLKPGAYSAYLITGNTPAPVAGPANFTLIP